MRERAHATHHLENFFFLTITKVLCNRFLVTKSTAFTVGQQNVQALNRALQRRTVLIRAAILMIDQSRPTCWRH